MTYADDILNTWVGVGSQIDGLGHLGENDMLYNCNKAGDVIKTTGLTKLGWIRYLLSSTRCNYRYD